MAFTAITAGQVDADSPVDSVLMGLLRTNLDDHESRIDANYSASNPVPQAGLETAQGSVSTAGANVNLTLPGGEYGFYPQLNDNGVGPISAEIGVSFSGTGYVTNITLSSVSGSVSAQHRYIQASPPYMIGSKKWGHFLYLLRRISDGVVVSSYEAEDPCWAYNGLNHLPKDHADRISAVPHPFADYWGKDPAVDGLEIVLVDLSTTNTKKWIGDNRKVGKGILEDVGTVLTSKGTNKAHSDYSIPVIPNFTDKVKIITP